MCSYNRLAREKVQSILDRSFNRQKLIFTPEEQFNDYVNVITDLMDPHTEYFRRLKTVVLKKN